MSNAKQITFGAMIAAIYTVLTLILAPISFDGKLPDLWALPLFLFSSL